MTSVNTADLVFDESVSSVVPADTLGTHAPIAVPAAPEAPLSAELLQRMHRYWQAANYLTVGQIFLQDNPLLRTRSGRTTSSRGCSATGGPRRA